MSRKPKTIVLDSWSVISYLEDEKAGSKVAEIIATAQDNNVTLKMSVVNLGEVWYIIARETSITDAEESIAELKELGIEFVAVDWVLTQQAALFKSKNRISFADCFAAALTKFERGELLTGDKEFKQIEKDIKIHWLE